MIMITGGIFSLFLYLSILSRSSTSIESDSVFTTLFPCHPTSLNNSNITEEISDCDVFVYSAVQLALDSVREELGNHTLCDLSVVTHNVQSIEVLYNLYVNIAEFMRFESSLSITRAAVGTDDNYVTGRQVLTIAQNIGVPMISYGLSDDRLNEFDNFYRTIPSTTILNQARLRLLTEFKWYRIGLLSSSETAYKYQMESFRNYFNLYIERQYKAELSYEGVSSDLHHSLGELQLLDIRIILGFFGPEESRSVLCEAEEYGLTSADHVWILPSYYSPDWWTKRGDFPHQTRNCNDEQMLEILQSVIFIDPVKFPSIGPPLSEFYDKLLIKTRSSFPGIPADFELRPFLQHSRAISAYDSTILLGKSLLDNGTVDIGTLRSTIVCELCRVYSAEFVLEEDYQICLNISSACQNGSFQIEEIPVEELDEERDILLHYYGQVLISQFIDGVHCPMVLFWPTNHSAPEQLKTNFVYINTLDDFNVSEDLELSAETLFANTRNCPQSQSSQSFTWKGTRTSSPSSNALVTSGVSNEALIFVGVWSLALELFIVFLIVFSIIWRDHKYVKCTSPRINVLILIGAVLATPYSFVQGFIISGTRFNLIKTDNPVGNLLCQFNLWLPSVGYALFIGGLTVKIFRLYRIFCNRSLKLNLRYMGDNVLIMVALLMVIPVLGLTIIWNPLEPFIYEVDYVKTESFHYIQVSSCVFNHETKVLLIIIDIYLSLLFLTAVGLLLFITQVSLPKPIKVYLQFTRVTLAVGAIVAFSGFIMQITSFFNGSAYLLRWWGLITERMFGITIDVIGLFFYQVVFVLMSRLEQTKEKCSTEFESQSVIGSIFRRRSSVKDQEKYMTEMSLQVIELTESLKQKEEAIRQIRAHNNIEQ